MELPYFDLEPIYETIPKIVMSKELPPKIEQDSPEGKILTYSQARIKIQEARERGLSAILAQGIFDVVHIGHIEYLREAKKVGDLLFLGIENDNAVRLNKGEKRPFNILEDRLGFLAELQSIDYVFGFENAPSYTDNHEMFTQRYRELFPNAVAVSSWDSNIDLKRRQADEAGIEIVLIDYGKRNSSTRLLQLIGYE